MLFIYIKQTTIVFNKKYCFILASVFCLFISHSFIEHYYEVNIDNSKDIRFSLAKNLYEIKNKGDLFTASASAIAYYSKWNSYDPWGLTTSEFGKEFFQPENLINYKPDILYIGYAGDKLFSVLLEHNSLENFNFYSPKKMHTRSFLNSGINLIKAAYMYGYEFWHYNKTNLIALKKDSKLYNQIKDIFTKLNIVKI